MKRKIILILSIITMVLLTSCEKNEEYCWKCNHETHTLNSYSSIIVTVCGMTYEEREAYEVANTRTNGDLRLITSCKLYVE